MDGPLEEPQQHRDEVEEVEEDDNESIDFVQIDQSEDEDEHEDSDHDQEEDHVQEHHNLVEGAAGEGGEQQQERNFTDWTFDGLMDSSAGGQSAAAAAAELVNLRMAALTAKNQLLEEQLKNAQLQAQIVENGVKFDALGEKNKTLESQLKNAECENTLKMVQLQAQIAESGKKFDVLEEKNKSLERELKCAYSELSKMPRVKTCGSCRMLIRVNSPVCLNCKMREEQLKNVQLQAHQIAEDGAKFDVLEEKNKSLESQLEKVELREKALEKKLEEKDKEVAQFTANLANLGKQLATLSGNSNKIELHMPRGNHWNSDASSPMFTMNSAVESTILPPPPAGMWGEGSGASEVKWHYAFALEGFPVLDAIMNKGQCNNVNSNKTTVFYYEVGIVDKKQEDHYHAIGLSMGYTKDFDDHVGQHPNSYGLDEFGQAYYICGKIHHNRENTPNKSVSASVSGSDDIYGFGLLVKPNKELAIFGTINGMLVGKQIPIQFWSEFLYPTVSVSKLTTKIEANFGNDPTVPFRYDIDNCPGLQL